MFSHKLFPDASLGEDAKRFTSWDFTLVSRQMCSGAYFGHLFRRLPRPLSEQISGGTVRGRDCKFLGTSPRQELGLQPRYRERDKPSTATEQGPQDTI